MAYLSHLAGHGCDTMPLSLVQVLAELIGDLDPLFQGCKDNRTNWQQLADDPDSEGRPNKGITLLCSSLISQRNNIEGLANCVLDMTLSHTITTQTI